MKEQKNLLFFVLVFLAIMVGWNYFYEAPKVEPQTSEAAPEKVSLPTAFGDVEKPEVSKDRAEVLSESSRLKIETAKLKGSINLQGARLDDLTLLQYHETVDKSSPNITLLSPEGTENPYFAEFGWVSPDKSIKLPDGETVWTVQDANSTQVSWNNGEGLEFHQAYSVDENYNFSITQRVTNNSDKPVKLYPYGNITRVGTPPTSGFFILHEGPLGYINNKLEEIKYDTLKEKTEIRQTSTGGWIGITDKYWLSALLPDQSKKFEYYFRSSTVGKTEAYYTGYYSEPVTIAPGTQFEFKTNLFAGAKVLALLDGYEETLGVKHFDLAVDFGWFYFLTKPIFHLLTYLHQLVGNFGIAILLFTVALRVLFFPLANKSFRSMARMKQLQPQIEELRTRYADDKMKLNQEIMALYKKKKANPMAGCLPMIVQIPVFFALYKVLFVSIEMRHTPFFGWIHDLSAPDPTTIFNLFGLLPFDPPSFLMIGVWPIIMGLTMFIQQKLNPAPADPIQAKMFMVMPVMLTVMLAQFPAGLVIYWAWSNMLAIAQQWVIQRSATKPSSKQAV